MGFPILDLVSIGSKLLDRILPDRAQADAAKLQLLQLQQTGELETLKVESGLASAQASVNQAEAGSSSLFVAGWRPFVGWVCGAALAYSFIVQPFIQFLVVLFKVNFDYKLLPILDWGMLGQLLFGMLGLAGMRSWEKIKGVSSGH